MFLKQKFHREKIDRHLNAVKALRFGVSYLDDALGALLPNDLFLIGALTGKGKTELATVLATSFASCQRRVSFFALEADQWEIDRRNKYRKMASIFKTAYPGLSFPRFREWLLGMGISNELDTVEKMAEEELAIDCENLNIVYKGSKYTAEEFVSDFEALQETTDVFIVDHLHYFDLASNTSEGEGLKNAIHSIRNASIHHGKPVILLAQLRKRQSGSGKKTTPSIDDFHGHSDIVKVATTILLLSAVPEDEASGINGKYPTYFHLAKCRTAGEVTPFVAIMGFDVVRNAYCENYYLCRSSFFEDPKRIENYTEIPTWAQRAVREPINPGFIGKNYYERD